MILYNMTMMPQKIQVAVFGGGCFWCTEAIFKALKGVVSVTPGYSGGHAVTPAYEDVCSGKTGHAEVIKIEFDPSVITFKDLLALFFATHDPTTLNRQGNDVGTQYRSIILYLNEGQREEAEEFIKGLDKSDTFGKPIVTELKPLEKFYEAETYHHDYYRNNPNNPYCQVVISPKLEKLQKRFAQLLKSSEDNT